MALPGSRRFVCMICMHVYDEALGDPDSGIEPGTPWEDIPGDWRCPRCGASKGFFEEEERFLSLPSREENAPPELREPGSAGLGPAGKGFSEHLPGDQGA